MSLKKLFLPAILLTLAGVVGACVDIPSGPGTDTNPNFRSQVRFVHAVPGGAAGNVVVDGVVVVSGLAFGANTTYYDIASGSRSVAFGSAPAQTISFGSEQQSTLVIYATATGIGYVNLIEGHKDKNNGKAGRAKAKFVHLSQGSFQALTFNSDSVTGPSASGTILFAELTQYRELEPATRTFVVVAPATHRATLSAAQEVPPVVDPLSTGTATVRVRPDSGFAYTVNVTSNNSQGFYTAAHFHNGAAGAVGPPVQTIDVSGQRMTFPATTVSGANQVPPVTTTSTGTGTFTLHSTTGFTYSVSVTSDNTQGFYTGAHIHSGAVGTNGPVVLPISVTAQRMTFDTTQLRGSNEVPPVVTSASGTATFTLTRDALTYSITVRRDSVDTTFTAAHFHTGLAGVVGPVAKTITSTSWSSQTRTFSGTWARTDTTEPLTDTHISDIIAGNIYVNVHSQGSPTGLIRGQLSVRPTSTNTFAGTWTASNGLTATTKDSLAKGLFYVNFHTANDPGGQIRAQIVPDPTTTNVYTGVWGNASLSPTILTELNAGKMYVNFHTALNPGGQIRGQLAFDPDFGTPGVATLDASPFEDGRMYTLILTGSGTSLAITKLADRQVSAPPTGKPAIEEVAQKND